MRTRPYEGSWAVSTSFKGQFNRGGEVRCPITEGKPFKFLGESRLEPATLGRCCDPMTVGRSRPAQSHARRSWVLQVRRRGNLSAGGGESNVGERIPRSAVGRTEAKPGSDILQFASLYYTTYKPQVASAKISTNSPTDTPRERRGGIHDRVERPATPLTSRGYQGL